MKNGIYFCPSLATHHLFPLTAALDNDVRVAAVLHDMIPLRRPVHEVGTIACARLKKALDRSNEFDLLVANSRATKAEYVSTYRGCDEIIVVRPRARFRRTKVGKPQMVSAACQKEYVLFGVANHPRKNVQICLDVANFFRSIKVDVVAMGGIQTDDLTRLVGNRVSDIVRFLPIVSDDHLHSLYENSRVVVVPSFDEGFSMHVLEAHTVGRPVIASDIPAHREQIDDASRLFDPYSPAALIEAYHAIGNNDAPSMRPIDHEAEEEELLDRLELLMA
ncbi:glycosyltransferase [Sphingomonas gei]|nr:glycosyltransferase [Sphingomonas gei]